MAADAASKVLCVDIGNTSAHCGVLEFPAATGTGVPRLVAGSGANIATAALTDAVGARVRRALGEDGIDGVSFCSVVPAATDALRAALAEFPTLRVHHLNHANCPGLGIHYPNPSEIGQDRLANCVGAQVLAGAPAVVVDMGTAVTFDILTAAGYEGGVIAPGLGVMTRYLHEQTALLPVLDPSDLLVSAGVGKTTLDAMRLGCAVGFAGMIGALLETVLAEMRKWGAAPPALLATGGTAGALPKAWAERIRWVPELTLLGLAESFRRTEAAVG